MKEIDNQLIDKLIEFDSILTRRNSDPNKTKQYQLWLDKFVSENKHNVSSAKKSCLYEFQAILHEAHGNQVLANEFIKDAMNAIKDNGGHLVSKTAIKIRSELPGVHEPDYEYDQNLGLFHNQKLSLYSAVILEIILVIMMFSVLFLSKNWLAGVMYVGIFTLAGLWVWETINMKTHDPELIPKWKNMVVDISAIVGVILFLSWFISSINSL